ncbi:myosin-2 heavy chain-like isoform X2 [Tripterygium wilfordii]|uniref:Myosin-2 heavy chain-like isoform X2 n=1 Tax=Tripterygium wilfordii TaxID=458696 RepID=A0A7J7DG52_TRIWF|nr:girdin-like [Tripterygium wilfordii]KAF5745350.1 myosin-2 heavy chain-like isoform X2 [Tripterygium wilfordii]
MASTKRTLKIKEIRIAENCMFWLDRLAMFQILSFSDDPTTGFLHFAFAACLLLFTHYNYVLLYIERRRINHPYSAEDDAKFNRLAFYGERVGFLFVILYLALGWPLAFEITLLLLICVSNVLYMLRYEKKQEEKYACTSAKQESEKIDSNAVGIEENKQSKSVEEEQKSVREVWKMYVDNQRLYSANEIDLLIGAKPQIKELQQVQKPAQANKEDNKRLYSANEINLRRLIDAKLQIKELQDQCHEHNKEKEDLTMTLDRVTKSLYNLSKDLTRLREANIDLVTKLSETSSWYKFQFQTTIDYENRNTILEQEKKKLQDNINEMRSSYELFNEVKSSYEFYRSCYEATEEDYKNLMEEKIELSVKFAAKTECSDKALQELEEKCRILEEENYEAHRNIYFAKMSTEMVDELEEQCRRLEREKTELMRGIFSSADVAVVNEWEEKCKRLEQEKTELMCENSAAKVAAEAVNELEVKCKSFEQENKLLLTEISTTKQAYADLMSEASAAQIYKSYLHDLDGDDLVIID